MTSLACCEAASQAARDQFLVQRSGRVYLADLQQGGNSLLYGPEISHCPFCGSKIQQDAVDGPPTTF